MVFFFIFVFSIQLAVNNVQYKFCRWRDSNLGPLVSEAIALPTEPQPLPKSLFTQAFPHNKYHHHQNVFFTSDASQKIFFRSSQNAWILFCFIWQKKKNFREHFWSQWDMKRGKKDLFFKLSLDCGWQLQMPPEWNGEGLPSNKWTNNIFKKHLLKRLLMALPEPLFVYFRAFQTSLQFCNK